MQTNIYEVSLMRGDNISPGLCDMLIVWRIMQSSENGGRQRTMGRSFLGVLELKHQTLGQVLTVLA